MSATPRTEEGKQAVFSRDDLGRLSLRLQHVCYGCPALTGSVSCPQAARCPVGMASRVIGTFLRTGAQVVTDDVPQGLQLPPGARIRADDAMEVLRSTERLCNRCMFHVNRCFLNVVHGLMEAALDLPNRKPPGKRPADYAARGP